MITNVLNKPLKTDAAILISPSQEELLCRFILKRTGIRLLDHQLNQLRKTVNSACKKFGYDSCDTYLSVIEDKTDISPELEYLIAGITVGETYFFRDKGQIKFLQEQWLSQIIRQKEKKGDKQLRIWSAGSSSGEEIYTMAILLAEAIDAPENWNIKLLGTDINTRVLSKAVAGRYTNWSFRATSDQLRNEYFTTAGNVHTIKHGLRKQVEFAYLNLAQDNFPSILTSTNHLDLILCRNVFIYFTPEVIHKILEKFSRCLNTGGILMVGASDLVESNSSGFCYRHVGDIGYYQLVDMPPEHSLVKPQKKRTAHPRRRILSTNKGVIEKKSHEWRTKLTGQQASQPVSQGLPLPQEYKEIIKLLGQERWQETLAVIDSQIKNNGTNALLCQWQAKALANLGQLEQAVEACSQSLVLDNTEKHTHFLHGLILADLGRSDEAIAALRKTLYLDHNFIEAHYRLGLLLLNSDQYKPGLKSLKNALVCAEKTDPDRHVHDAVGLTVGRLVEILKQEIELYGNKIADVGK